MKTGITLSDARETREYNASHLKKAVPFGFDHFDQNAVSKKTPNKKAVIVVYCSIGNQSEKIVERLPKMRYTKALNLYRGIFEWKNKGETVVDNNGTETDSVHAFSTKWSFYLKKGIKAY